MQFTYCARWWVWTLRGVFAIVFGLLALVMPGLTLALLILLFGIWAFVDGITHLSLALQAEAVHPWIHGLEGLIGMAVGVIAFFYPMATALALVYVIAVWAILTGIARVALSFQLRDLPSREWLIGLSGVLAVIFGLILVWAPEAGAIAISFWIGIFALVAGLVFVGLSLRMRRLHRLLTDGL
jgi:uncharacterized membrane protein HdeD (DUF308 family)